VRLSEDWVSTLAEFDDEQLPQLAAHWKDVEEVNFADAAAALYRVQEFRALARRTRDHGQNLYCVSVV
jgi:hypothetical protein